MVIECEGVTKKFGKQVAVADVNMRLERGEIVGFVGLNGAGKSTTINILLGFLKASSGDVRLFGEKVTPQSAHNSHKKLGFASGDMSLFSNMTGKRYLDYVLKSYGQTGERRDELIQLFSPEMNKRISQLSRGNKQKIALIAAFMTRPELVVLDEPSSGLDPLMQDKFEELVRAEGERGTTIFMSSHYLGEVADVCTRVIFMRDGRIVKDIQASDIAKLRGKIVQVTSKQVLRALKSAENVIRRNDSQSHTIGFIYRGNAAKLQQWLSSAPGVIDFSVAEHDPEAIFGELYKHVSREEENNE